MPVNRSGTCEEHGAKAACSLSVEGGRASGMHRIGMDITHYRGKSYIPTYLTLMDCGPSRFAVDLASAEAAVKC